MTEYIALLEDLIRCRPVSSDIPAVNNATMRMRDFLSAHGLYCTLEESADGRKLLYAAPREGKKPDYLFNAHLDVVPALESMFTPVQQGNRMYGRGATDCLGNAVAVARFLGGVDCQVQVSPGCSFALGGIGYGWLHRQVLV